MRLLLLLAIPVFAHGQVKVAGEMKKIMQQGNLSASIDLDTLRSSEQLYGLGVAENLKGEIMIVAGQGYVTQVDAGHLKTSSTSGIKSAMFVFQSVTSWVPARVERPVPDLQALEGVLEELMKSNGKNKDESFAFLIKTSYATINYHVIDWQPGTAHTMSNHKAFSKPGQHVNGDVTILGFYSNHHQGVFTHHGTNIHLHMMTNDRKLVGHVDGLSIDRPFEVLLAGGN